MYKHSRVPFQTQTAYPGTVQPSATRVQQHDAQYEPEHLHQQQHSYQHQQQHQQQHKDTGHPKSAGKQPDSQWTEIKEELEQLRLKLKAAEDEDRKTKRQLQDMCEKNSKQGQEIITLKLGKKSLQDNFGRMIDDQLNSDESKLETIGDHCSPMHVKDQFLAFASQELLYAQDFMERTNDSTLRKLSYAHDKFTLMDVIKRTYTLAKQRRLDVEAHMLKDFKNSLKYPRTTPSLIASRTEHTPLKKSHWQTLDRDVEHLVKKHLRREMDATDFAGWAVELKIFREDVFVRHHEMAQFLGKCLEICWKMVLQNPDMEFEFPKTGSPFDERRHNRGNISYTNSASIEQVSHPALLHGDTLMCPATVLLYGPEHTPRSHDRDRASAKQHDPLSSATHSGHDEQMQPRDSVVSGENQPMDFMTQC